MGRKEIVLTGSSKEEMLIGMIVYDALLHNNTIVWADKGIIRGIGYRANLHSIGAYPKYSKELSRLQKKGLIDVFDGMATTRPEAGHAFQWKRDTPSKNGRMAFFQLELHDQTDKKKAHNYQVGIQMAKKEETDDKLWSQE